jgi:hypothetical protein
MSLIIRNTMRADIEEFEPVQNNIMVGRVPGYRRAIPIHHEHGFQLRGYQPSEKNEKLVSSKPAISDEAIVAFLNAQNLIYCQIEIYSERNMPFQEFRIFLRHVTKFDILNSVIANVSSNLVITEIHVTPVYQTIEGFPKIFTDEDQSISVLTALKKSPIVTIDDLNIYA